MANSRQEKIARYKEQKEQERRLKVLNFFLLHALKLNPTTVSHCYLNASAYATTWGCHSGCPCKPFLKQKQDWINPYVRDPPEEDEFVNKISLGIGRAGERGLTAGCVTIAIQC